MSSPLMFGTLLFITRGQPRTYYWTVASNLKWHFWRSKEKQVTVVEKSVSNAKAWPFMRGYIDKRRYGKEIVVALANEAERAEFVLLGGVL